MSDLERLVLEKHQLIRQLMNGEAVLFTLLQEIGPTSLKTTDIEANMGKTVNVEQLKTIIKLEATDDEG